MTTPPSNLRTSGNLPFQPTYAVGRGARVRPHTPSLLIPPSPSYFTLKWRIVSYPLTSLETSCCKFWIFYAFFVLDYLAPSDGHGLDFSRILGVVLDLTSFPEISYVRGAPKPKPPNLPPRRADFVLAADCVYFEPAFPLLVATLCDLADSDGNELNSKGATEPEPEPEMLFCYKKRRKVSLRLLFSIL